jgi:hypothetical protein
MSPRRPSTARIIDTSKRNPDALIMLPASGKGKPLAGGLSPVCELWSG